MSFVMAQDSDRHVVVAWDTDILSWHKTLTDMLLWQKTLTDMSFVMAQDSDRHVVMAQDTDRHVMAQDTDRHVAMTLDADGEDTITPDSDKPVAMTGAASSRGQVPCGLAPNRSHSLCLHLRQAGRPRAVLV